MSAARRAGLIDRALLHDDYQLADELYDLAVKLGGGLLALICPNHRRTKTLKRFPRSGMHYAMLCLGNEALQSEEEFEKDEEENGVFTIPTGQGHRKPTIAGACLVITQAPAAQAVPVLLAYSVRRMAQGILLVSLHCATSHHASSLQCTHIKRSMAGTSCDLHQT